MELKLSVTCVAGNAKAVSGKSTLLNLIAMLDEFNECEYYFEEEAIHQLKSKKRIEIFNQNVEFIFQAYHLLDDLTIYENIETPLLYKNVKSSERKALVADILQKKI